MSLVETRSGPVRPYARAMARTLHRTVACLLTASLFVVACGDDDDVEATAEDTTTTVEDTTTTSTSAAPTSSTAPGELPGERIEIFPYEDAELAVVGVEADDTLNVRSGPSVDFEVVAELDPLAEGMNATGHNRSLDDGFWAEIDVDGTVGWANVKYLAQLGRVDDITTEVVDRAGERPRTDTMLQLGQLVADQRTSDQAPQTEVTVVDGPTVDGDLGEITVDLLGFGDDAVGGERLHIFGEEGEGGESFVLRTVERTLFCIRGVTDDGLCV